MEKRGLSGVVTTVLLILISIIAVIIIWQIIRNLASPDVETGRITTELEISCASLNGNILNVSVERGAGQGNIVGLAFKIGDEKSADTETVNSSIPQLGKQSYTIDLSGKQYNAKKISVAGIFKTSKGNEIIGPILDSKDIGSGACSGNVNIPCSPIVNPCFNKECGGVANGSCGNVNCPPGCSSGYSCNNLGRCVLSSQPQINLNLINPTGNINIDYRKFFNVTVKVSCLQADCGNIDVSLDPELTLNTIIEDGDVQSSMTDCSITYFDQPTCDAHPPCNWNYEYGYCQSSFFTYTRSKTGTIINTATLGGGYKRGYIEFDTSSIPDGATTINSVHLNIKIRTTDLYGREQILKPITTKPSLLSDEPLYNDIGDGTTYATITGIPSFPADYEWKNVDLGSQAVIDLTNHLGWFAVGLYESPLDNFIEGSESADVPELIVDYSPSGVVPACNLPLRADCRKTDQTSCENAGCLWSNTPEKCVINTNQGCGLIGDRPTCDESSICEWDKLTLNTCYTCTWVNGFCYSHYKNCYVIGAVSEKTVLISTIKNTKPFYTNATNNPWTINLNKDQSKIVTFWVNATGDYGEYDGFFVYANKTSNPEISAYTSKFDVTII